MTCISSMVLYANDDNAIVGLAITDSLGGDLDLGDLEASTSLALDFGSGCLSTAHVTMDGSDVNSIVLYSLDPTDLYEPDCAA